MGAGDPHHSETGRTTQPGGQPPDGPLWGPRLPESAQVRPLQPPPSARSACQTPRPSQTTAALADALCSTGADKPQAADALPASSSWPARAPTAHAAPASTLGRFSARSNGQNSIQRITQITKGLMKYTKTLKTNKIRLLFQKKSVASFNPGPPRRMSSSVKVKS